jgi:hypothetical protein
MKTFLVFLTVSLAIACAGIVSVGIAWAARSGAPRSASPPQETQPSSCDESVGIGVFDTPGKQPSHHGAPTERI